MSFEELVLLTATDAVISDWSHNLQTRTQNPKRDVESNLIVAGARRTVSDGDGADAAGKVGDHLSLNRPFGGDRTTGTPGLGGCCL